MTATDATLDGLLRAVLERPDDDLPRLVMADALEELPKYDPCPRSGKYPTYHDCGKPCPICHGENVVPNSNAERAEFVRVQVELARLGDPKPHSISGQRCACDGCTLRRRERELWGWWRETWFPPYQSIGNIPGPFAYALQADANLRVPNLIVRRGFVESVTCDLATLFSGPCENCGGFGEFRRRLDNGDGPEGPCPNCGGKWNSGPHDDTDSYWDRGTGRTPGVAPALFGAQPVIRVTLTDREPYSIMFGWYDAAHPGLAHASTNTSLLPTELFDRLPVEGRHTKADPTGERTGRRDYWAWWSTRDAALDALSQACVAWGRANAAGRWWGVCERCEGELFVDELRVGEVSKPLLNKARRPVGWDCPACDGTGKRRGLPPFIIKESK